MVYNLFDIGIRTHRWLFTTLWTGAVSVLTSAKRIFRCRNQLGYGFSFAYRRAVHQLSHHNDEVWGSDYHFISTAIQKGARFGSFRDEIGLALHMLHQNNVSCCLPNYVLPPFMLRTLFPGMTGHLWFELR
jgi:hypothetical protein